MCNLQKRLIRAPFWVLPQAMFMNDWKQTAKQLKMLERLPTTEYNLVKHIQRQQFSFKKTSIKVSLKILGLQAYSLSLCFKPASRCLLFWKMNSRQENRSKLSFTARIVTKFSLDPFLSICGAKMSKGFLMFCKLISNLILYKRA